MILFLFFFHAAVNLAYTDVTTVTECYSCIQYQGNIVCRDER